MSETIAGITIPDSALAREATELVRDATSDVVFNHSRRVYLFGELRGRETGVTADPELLYVGAMFHDLGLTERYGSDDQRFELDGADQARRFLLSHGITEDDATDVWTAIALHTTPEIPLHMTPVVALVTRVSSWTSSASATTPSRMSSARRWWRRIRGRTSRRRSSRRSTRACDTAPTPRSATSRPMCSRTSSRDSCVGTSSR